MWDVRDAIMDVVYAVLIALGSLITPKLWGGIKLLGLSAFPLLCILATVVVYNSPGAQENLVVQLVVTTWFATCTAFAFMVLIYYGRQQAMDDALMG